MNKHPDFAMVVLKLNHHELKDAFTEGERCDLEKMTTHMYFPTLKNKSTFDQDAHDNIVKLAQQLGII